MLEIHEQRLLSKATIDGSQEERQCKMELLRKTPLQWQNNHLNKVVLGKVLEEYLTRAFDLEYRIQSRIVVGNICNAFNFYLSQVLRKNKSTGGVIFEFESTFEDIPRLLAFVIIAGAIPFTLISEINNIVPALIKNNFLTNAQIPKLVREQMLICTKNNLKAENLLEKKRINLESPKV